MARQKDVSTSEPEFMDYVKHKKNDTTGTVIAVYPFSSASLQTQLRLKDRYDDLTITDDTIFFDVRGDDDKIHYGTPAENWEIVRKADE